MPAFRVNKDGRAEQIEKVKGLVEKDIQKLIEGNLDSMLRLKFIQSEYSTGRIHGGRIDTLSFDESIPVPVIIEYKNKRDKNVLIQGFYYYGWALDHQSEIINLAKEQEIKNADKIDIRKTRVVCIAPEFIKEEIYAAATWNAWFNLDIQLLTFSMEGSIFRLNSATDASLPVCKSNGSGRPVQRVPNPPSQTSKDSEKLQKRTTVARLFDEKWKHFKLFQSLCDYALSFDKIEMHDNSEYVGFRKVYNLFIAKGYDDCLKITVDIAAKNRDVLEMIKPYVSTYPSRLLEEKESSYKVGGMTFNFKVKSPEDLQLLFPIIEIICENN